MRASLALFLSVPLAAGLAGCPSSTKDANDTDVITDDAVTDTDALADTDVQAGDTDDTDAADTDVVDTDTAPADTATEDTDLVTDTSGDTDSQADTDVADTDSPADTDVADTDSQADTDSGNGGTIGDTDSGGFQDTGLFTGDTFDTTDTGPGGDTGPWLDTAAPDTYVDSGMIVDTSVTGCAVDPFEVDDITPIVLSEGLTTFTGRTLQAGDHDQWSYTAQPGCSVVTTWSTYGVPTSATLAVYLPTVLGGTPLYSSGLDENGVFATGTIAVAAESILSIDPNEELGCVEYQITFDVQCPGGTDTGVIDTFAVDTAPTGDTTVFDTAVLDTASDTFDTGASCPADAWESDDLTPVMLPVGTSTYTGRTVTLGDVDQFLWRADPGCGISIDWTADALVPGARFEFYAPAIGSAPLTVLPMDVSGHFDVANPPFSLDVIAVIVSQDATCLTYDITVTTSCGPVDTGGVDTGLIVDTGLVVDTGSTGTFVVDTGSTGLVVDTASTGTIVVDTASTGLAVDTANTGTFVVDTASTGLVVDTANTGTFVVDTANTGLVADSGLVGACPADPMEPDDILAYPVDLSSGFASVTGRALDGTDLDQLQLRAAVGCSPVIQWRRSGATTPGLTYDVQVAELGNASVASGAFDRTGRLAFSAPPFDLNVTVLLNSVAPACNPYQIDIWRGCPGDPLPPPPVP